MQSVNSALMLYSLATDLVHKSSKFLIFCKNQTSYFNKIWINTRIICTHLNVFVMLKPNMTMYNLKFKNFWKKLGIFVLSSAFDIRTERVDSSLSASSYIASWLILLGYFPFQQFIQITWLVLGNVFEKRLRNLFPIRLFSLNV